MILKPFSYLNDFLKLAANSKKWPLNEIRAVGSRFSGKTWNFAEFTCDLLNLVNNNQEMVRASAFILRRDLYNLDELWDQYNTNLSNVILEQNVKTLNAKKKWVFENGNEVRFKHTNYKNKNKTVGAGWSCARGDYIVVIYEEAYEFSNVEIARVREAVRGANPNASILEIFICNPWDPRNYFIANTLKNFPYDMNQIEQFGEQKAIVQVYDDKLDFYKPVIIHYANWRAIQRHEVTKTKTGINMYKALPPIIIPQSKLDQLTLNYSLDYESALTADYGCAGASGTEQIYFRAMKYIGEPIYFEHELVIGGGDIGNGRSKKSGKTAFTFAAYDITGYWDVYGEYVWDNKASPKLPRQIYNEVVDFYLYEMEEYSRKTGHIFNIDNPLFVRVDLSNGTDISILNEICGERGIDFIEFVPCLKLPIGDRITSFLYKMEQGLVRIDPIKCSNLLDELSGAEWDDTNAEEPKRKNDKDHSINALEYSFEEIMGSCFAAEDRERYWSKLTPRTKKYI